MDFGIFLCYTNITKKNYMDKKAIFRLWEYELMSLFDFLKQEKTAGLPVWAGRGVLVQPMDGEIIPLSAVEDSIVPAGTAYRGCGLIPSGEGVYAPAAGVISAVSAAKHQVRIVADGVELLIQVGTNTASMNGRGFDVKVKPGDRVKAGRLLLTFSLSEIQKTQGVEPTCAIVVTNSKDLPDFEVLHTGMGKVGRSLFRVARQGD